MTGSAGPRARRDKGNQAAGERLCCSLQLVQRYAQAIIADFQ
jgi:hypothetical protein